MSEAKRDPKKVGKPESVREGTADYSSLIDERYEIIGGVRYDYLSSPTTVHQELAGLLLFAFHSHCSREGKTFVAPLDVHFDEENIFQPDVIYISKENSHILRDGYIYGAPDLVVEILSDSTVRRDKTIKKDGYERFGVKEYWLVDPVYMLVDQFVLLEGRYELVATLGSDDRIVSATIPCVSFDLKNVFSEEDGAE